MNIPGQNNPQVAILGPGAIGGFLSALFYKKGFSVLCIAKEETCEIISREGIYFESAALGSFTLMPKVVTHLDVNTDILFVTTKATELADAQKRVKPQYVAGGIIIPLLNGIEHMDMLRIKYGRRVLAASIGSVEVKRPAPNHIVHTTPSAHIELASNKDIFPDRLNEITQLINSLGITARILNSEAEVLWGKLIRLNAIALTTSLLNRPIGFIRSDNIWRRQLEGCVKEASLVASFEGLKTETSTVMEQIDKLPENLGTSMQRDINLRKPSELDAIAGAIIRAGKRHGIKCPIIQHLKDRIEEKIKCQRLSL